MKRYLLQEKHQYIFPQPQFLRILKNYHPQSYSWFYETHNRYSIIGEPGTYCSNGHCFEMREERKQENKWHRRKRKKLSREARRVLFPGASRSCEGANKSRPNSEPFPTGHDCVSIATYISYGGRKARPK
ncbi:hypothetical protein CEXT_481851 [Caerostris extrusa]|uniref:Uncharacterized protein n=1 Tax=Caerostris extrusa TaxID=172846 RepID=A0AAV4MCH5_CAEEX|nr:hypothetical protein CEXT_481851 [Caerostris extrusa]